MRDQKYMNNSNNIVTVPKKGDQWCSCSSCKKDGLVGRYDENSGSSMRHKERWISRSIKFIDVIIRHYWNVSFDIHYCGYNFVKVR
jgi:hypothetical protein